MALTAIWLFCLELKSVSLRGGFGENHSYTLELTTIITAIIIPFFICLSLAKYIWFILSIILLTSSLTYSFHSNFWTQDSTDSVIVFMVVLAFIRIGWLHYFYFRRNPHRFMEGKDQRKLIGESGILMQDLKVGGAGKVCLSNPIYRGAVLECISDEALARNLSVRVSDIECGVLKVVKA